jgi:hypothetical protein
LGDVSNTDKLKRQADTAPEAKGTPRFVVDDYRVNRWSGNVTTRKRFTKAYGVHRGQDGALRTERFADGNVLAVHLAASDGSIAVDDLTAIVVNIRDGYTAHWQWFSTLQLPRDGASYHGYRRAERNRHRASSAS